MAALLWNCPLCLCTMKPSTSSTRGWQHLAVPSAGFEGVETGAELKLVVRGLFVLSALSRPGRIDPHV